MDQLTRSAPPLRQLIGAVVGLLSGLGGVLIADWLGLGALLPVIPVIAVAAVGLLFGWRSATWCYLAATLSALLAIITIGPAGLQAASLVRLAFFVFGGPVIVLLVRRTDMLLEAAERSRDAEAEAHALARERQAELERMQRELAHAYLGVDHERARLEEVAEAIQEPVVVYDDKSRGIYGNRAALRLFGRRFVESDPATWGEIAHPRDERGRPLVREVWPQVRGQRESFRGRLTLRLPVSGRDVHVSVEGSPIAGGGCVLLLRDIGKEEEARRRLSRFASFVAHELRNPLAVAKARIELAQRSPHLPTRVATHGRRALESVDAAIGILERLELYSRAEAGRIEARRERFALIPALDAAVEQLRTRGSDRKVRLLVPQERVRVVGDRYLAQQAISNLLTNAERYSEPGAPIRVEVTDGEIVTLRVIDAGPGISDEVADRLFSDRVTAGTGLGLGLYLVAATMQAMGGSVHLEQRRPAAVFALRWQRARR